jgi:hypothetical protein
MTGPLALRPAPIKLAATMNSINTTAAQCHGNWKFESAALSASLFCRSSSACEASAMASSSIELPGGICQSVTNAWSFGVHPDWEPMDWVSVGRNPHLLCSFFIISKAAFRGGYVRLHRTGYNQLKCRGDPAPTLLLWRIISTASQGMIEQF